MRVAIVNPGKENRNETSPSLLGDREGRARPGDRNTCVNKYNSKGNRFKLNYLQFLWGKRRAWLANTVSETIKNNYKQFVNIATK